MSGILKFLKDWMLIVAMATGALLYILYREIPVLHPYGGILLSSVKSIQPVLLFSMLLLAFSKISPRDLKPHRWQLWVLLLQGAFYVIPALVLVMLGGFSGALSGWRVGVESFMLCMICPTATACSVMTAKLGGSRAGVMTYTIMINFLVAMVVPLIVPLMHPVVGLDFWNAFFIILAKVFPMLILPCLCAWIIRYCFKKLHTYLSDNADLAFTIWALSLTLAILMSVRAIYHSACGIQVLGGIALASLIACAFQFWAGKKIGGIYGDRITAGQAMGQKSTVFAIWMAYTFMDPLTSVSGGFYSLWHNAYNSWQLYKIRNGKPL